jgi:hypothetical protein
VRNGRGHCMVERGTSPVQEVSLIGRVKRKDDRTESCLSPNPPPLVSPPPVKGEKENSFPRKRR